MKISKILLLIISVVFFSSCSKLFKTFKYYPIEKNAKIGALGKFKKENEENSYLEYIEIYNKNDWNRKIFLLSANIKIVHNGKEYIIPHFEEYNKNSIYVYVYKNGVNITDGDFTAHIGKVQLDTGEIVEIPPLHFKKYISIEKYNVILDTLNQDANRKSFSGTLEEYKKNGWKEE